MNEKWNLDNIYTSIESDKFKNDYEKYKNTIDELNKWTEENLNQNNKSEDNKKIIEYYLTKKNDIIKLNTVSLYINLALSVNTTDEKLLKIIDKIEEISSRCSVHETLFKNYIKNIDIENLRKSSDIIDNHYFILNEIKESAKYSLSREKEEIASYMKSTGSVMWKKLWEQLTSTLKVDIEIDGENKQLPLSVIRNYAYSESSSLRKKAYYAELKAYEKIDKSAAFSLNSIKGEVMTLSKMRGYKSVFDMTAIESRLDAEIINIMFDSMRNYLPKFRDYFKKKAQILGYKKALPFYDLFAPIGNSKIEFSYEEAQKFILDSFYGFSSRLGDFAKNAFENCWIDVYPREGKVGGAFCEAIHGIGESRILTNFTGSFNDVVTIAHELGHAYHDSCLYNESGLNSYYPMPIAETASTLCETIVTKEALKRFGKEDSLIILESDISSAAQVIVDIFSRFIFEDNLFKERKNGFLSVNELKNIMIDAQKETYSDGLDEKYLHPYMWICKPHYYDADFNYYNFPYAFGLLFSKGLYEMYIREGEGFIEKYDKLLSISGKNYLADAAKSVGIDLYKNDFWNGALNLICDDIDNMCQ